MIGQGITALDPTIGLLQKELEVNNVQPGQEAAYFQSKGRPLSPQLVFLIQANQQLQKESQMAQARPPQGTVADDLSAALVQKANAQTAPMMPARQQGVAQLPNVNVGSQRAYAGGGIVAFGNPTLNPDEDQLVEDEDKDKELIRRIAAQSQQSNQSIKDFILGAPRRLLRAANPATYALGIGNIVKVDPETGRYYIGDKPDYTYRTDKEAWDAFNKKNQGIFNKPDTREGMKRVSRLTDGMTQEQVDNMFAGAPLPGPAPYQGIKQFAKRTDAPVSHPALGNPDMSGMSAQDTADYFSMFGGNKPQQNLSPWEKIFNKYIDQNEEGALKEGERRRGVTGETAAEAARRKRIGERLKDIEGEKDKNAEDKKKDLWMQLAAAGFGSVGKGRTFAQGLGQLGSQFAQGAIGVEKEYRAGEKERKKMLAAAQDAQDALADAEAARKAGDIKGWEDNQLKAATFMHAAGVERDKLTQEAQLRREGFDVQREGYRTQLRAAALRTADDNERNRIFQLENAIVNEKDPVKQQVLLGQHKQLLELITKRSIAQGAGAYGRAMDVRIAEETAKIEGNMALTREEKDAAIARLRSGMGAGGGNRVSFNDLPGT